ncbi:MAG: porin family protein [Cyclobacteriaceae bacterium]|nr:porin family protein [Cyclobacteriaceae bacterium]
MKKFIYVIFLMTFFSNSFSQTISLRGGVNIANMLSKDDDESYSDSYSPKVGLNLGVITEFNLSENIGLETGFIYSGKGFSSSLTYTDPIAGEFSVEGKASLLYFEIPINVKPYFNLGNLKVFSIIGPYIGIGLRGKTIFETKALGFTEKIEEDIKWGTDEDNDHFKRLDAGLNFGGGIEFNKFQISVNYQHGLMNISPTNENGAKIKNRVAALTVSYMFNKN